VVAALLPSVTAGADSVTAVRDRMEALEHQIIADAARIHTLAQSYTQEALGEQSLAQAIASQQVQIDALSVTVAARRTALRGELVLGYVGEYSGVPAGEMAGTGVTDPAVRLAYIAIATGSLRDTLDSYTATRAALAGARSQLVSEQASRRAAAARAAAARRAALADVAAAQGRLDQLQVQLISLQRQAVVASGVTGLAGTTQGLPVGGGLLEVVTSELSPPSGSTSGAAPPTTAAPTTTPPTTTPPTTTAATTTPTTTGSGVGPTSTTVSNHTTTTLHRTAPTTTTVPRSTSTSAPPVSVVVTGSGGAPGVWLELRLCESGDNYAENTGNGFYGAYQFSEQTWTGLGYPGRPDLEPPGMQDQAAMKLQSESGWGQWPACAAALGLT